MVVVNAPTFGWDGGKRKWRHQPSARAAQRAGGVPASHRAPPPPALAIESGRTYANGISTGALGVLHAARPQPGLHSEGTGSSGTIPRPVFAHGPENRFSFRRPLVRFGSYYNTFRRIHTYTSAIAPSTCGRDNVCIPSWTKAGQVFAHQAPTKVSIQVTGGSTMCRCRCSRIRSLWATFGASGPST